LGEDRYWLPIKPAIPLHVGAFWREEGGQNGLHGHVSPRNTRRLSVDRLSKRREESGDGESGAGEIAEPATEAEPETEKKELSDEPSALELCNL